jgi:hypothetical protein
MAPPPAFFPAASSSIQHHTSNSPRLDGLRRNHWRSAFVPPVLPAGIAMQKKREGSIGTSP